MSFTRAKLTGMVLPRLHRVVLSLVAVVSAAVACVLVGSATTDVVQCLWALAAGVSVAVALGVWWPGSETAAPRPPLSIDGHASLEAEDEPGRETNGKLRSAA